MYHHWGYTIYINVSAIVLSLYIPGIKYKINIEIRFKREASGDEAIATQPDNVFAKETII